MSTITGGCHCGAIRYQIEGEMIVHALCHCRDCRLHAGAPVVGWTMYAENAVKVTKGEPKVYRSSEHVRRHFCADCGTGLFYFNASMQPGVIDVQSATYDIPMRCRRRCRSRSPSGFAGWSTRTSCRRSTAFPLSRSGEQ
ncbi:Glutathione-dependent formaldehyde-activating enzyme [Bradyrhizobium sp. Rc2d]|uniref:GFA family protein n=1 Tax=Bradyrhizobium sp. Rc2d TaxID=1855321 RepID=UPI00088FF61A|nr:GFA family protein [Bradyrhizobium sp. Rc2d]SDI37626.1 Glutathione-dependent formaldehyde-activating enzyme [Bradyrhizobium sp. Rc2d]